MQDGIVDDLAAGAAAGEGSYQLEGATGSDGEAAGKPATAAGSRRQPLLHPGYFTRARGPSYTPAPPEAILDARELYGGAAAALGWLTLPLQWELGCEALLPSGFGVSPLHCRHIRSPPLQPLLLPASPGLQAPGAQH